MVQFKTYELFNSGIFHLIFSDHGWPQVTEVTASKTGDVYARHSFQFCFSLSPVRSTSFTWNLLKLCNYVSQNNFECTKGMDHGSPECYKQLKFEKKVRVTLNHSSYPIKRSGLYFLRQKVVQRPESFPLKGSYLPMQFLGIKTSRNGWYSGSMGPIAQILFLVIYKWSHFVNYKLLNMSYPRILH